ncbi:MAG: hypothetical protein M1812_007752 [Candelaria pacifica]|nr:MAG: hypothetical protein M1812_007752 [Candelaria pacifica]
MCLTLHLKAPQEGKPNTETSQHGAMYANAVSKVFIQTEYESFTQLNHNPTFPDDNLEINSIFESTSYTKLNKVINNILSNETYKAENTKSITLSAKEDKWNLEWGKRSNLILNQIKALWNHLAPQKIYLKHHTNNSSTQLPSQKNLGKTGYYVLPQRYSKSASRKHILDLCKFYTESHPPADNEGTNTNLHPLVKEYLEENAKNSTPTKFLHDALSYRINSDKLATEYKNILHLDFPDCHEVDVIAFQRKFVLLDPGCRENPGSKYNMFEAFHRLIFHAMVFEGPARWQGYYHTKSANYLAIAFVENKLSQIDVEEAIRKILAG